MSGRRRRSDSTSHRGHRSTFDPWANYGPNGERSLHAGTRGVSVQVDRAGRYKLTAPAAIGGTLFAGVRNNVQFTAGVGRTDDLARARALEEAGFAFEDTGDGGPQTAAQGGDGGNDGR